VADVEEKKVSDLTPDVKNANKGTERGEAILEHSLQQYGAGRSILLDREGRIIAGNKTAGKAGEIGIEDVIVVKTDGNTLVAVQRTDLDLDEPRARELAFADNRAGEVDLAWDHGALLEAMNDDSISLDALWTDEEMQTLLEQTQQPEKGIKPNPRNLPIDAIFTLSTSSGVYCCMACRAGMSYGIQSPRSPCKFSDVQEAHKVQFVDNEYVNYDHQKHLDFVTAIRPKYATTRDLMSVEQCQEAEIPFYEYEQVMDWAAEISEVAENVIIIPKYAKVLDKIPPEYMLGYSVPTSHGGTPLPAEAFKGRRVHLLGGSWAAQLSYMAELGDDVLSFDNNYILKQSLFASFVLKDGTTKTLTDVGLEEGDVTNPSYVAFAISCGAVAAGVNEIYGGAASAEEQDPDLSGQADDR